MKKIKLLIQVILLIFVFSGCNFTYNIEFVNQKIEEETIGLIENSKLKQKISNITNEGDYGEALTYGEYLDVSLSSKSHALIDSQDYFYKKKLIKNDGYTGIRHQYTYDVSNYQSSSNANMCYKFFKFYSLGDLYILSTNKQFECFKYKDLKDITIHIKSNHKVKNTNAHKIDGYNYYWYLQDNDNVDNSIQIEFYKDKYVFNYENKFLYTMIGIVFVAFSTFIAIIVLRRKSIKNNKI